MEQPKYILVKDLPIAKKGEIFTLVNDFYVNLDETILLRSTDYTGKIIKKDNEQRNNTI